MDLSNLKIVVDCAEGASSYTSVKTLTDLGANLIAIHTSPDGTNINANCGSTHMDELCARVVSEKADVGIAFDGDADRMLAVDEKGNDRWRCCYGYLRQLSEAEGKTCQEYDCCYRYVKSRIFYYGKRKRNPC